MNTPATQNIAASDFFAEIDAKSAPPERVANPSLTFFESIAIPLARERGLKVAPCYPRQKKVHGELVPEPLKMHSSDISQIRAWAQREPDANVCVYAQQIEGGLCFLDRDGARDIREAYRSTTGKDFQTLFVRSSVKNGVERGHFYFRQTPKTRNAKNITEESTNGWFSFRVNNFYVCSIGSIHPDTGEPYTVIDDSPILPMPDELLEWLQAQAAPKPKTRGEATGRGKFKEGTRYTALISEVGRLWHRGYSHALTIKTGIEWARENFDLAGAQFDEQKVRKEIEHLIDSYPQGTPTIAPVVDDEPTAEKESDIVPSYPSDTIDGDLIGELTRALTDGSFIPPQFMRENIKVALGLIVDGFVGFPNHEDLHTREYLHNISVYPQSGKGESYKRTSQPSTGFIFELLRKLGVSIVDGGLFGSGEFMVKVLNDAPTHRAIARFDEMSEVWAKNRAIGCTLEKKLLTLFESTSAAQGSFKNGVNAATDFHLALVGDFTKESFDASFTGSGSRGSGYLSRCVFQFADRQPWEGDWLSIDTDKARRILSAIDARLTEILNGKNHYVPTETAEAKSLRLEFYVWLDTQDARFTPRLKDHLKRDALLRAALGGGTITPEMMRRSIEWCRNQLDNRLALFPEDAGSPTEIMERLIIKTLKAKGRASERELKRACHVSRAGSGGHEIFNRALRSLKFSHEIKMAGTTRSGTPLYELFGVS